MSSTSNNGHTFCKPLPTMTAPWFSKSSAPQKLNTFKVSDTAVNAARKRGNPLGDKLLWPRYNSSSGGLDEFNARNTASTPSSVNIMSFTFNTCKQGIFAIAFAKVSWHPRKLLSLMFKCRIWVHFNKDSAIACPPSKGFFMYCEVPHRMALIWKISKFCWAKINILPIAIAPSLFEVDSPKTNSFMAKVLCVSAHNSKQRNTSSQAAAANPVSKNRNVFKLCFWMMGWSTLMPRVPNAL